ncbi:MAG: hypothetical protein MSH22_01765 [Spirochaetia bacterium]|nr:hypothetical protein [Spirochaetia bacterium]MCI7798588.1 hypothetical protein [Spirochaetia bacterium]
MKQENVKTIRDFFSNKEFSFPEPPTAMCDSVNDLYENCIKITVQPDRSIIEKWHDLLVRYANDSESVKLSRLYEHTSKGKKKVYENGIEIEKEIWDTRRGMQTVMQDGYTYAFASNYFARLIFSMAYAGFVPEYDDFKSMFLNHEFPLFYLGGTTECEREFASFKTKPYKACFYTQHWYLAHIISVKALSFYGYPEVDLYKILSRGELSDWKKAGDIYIRSMNKSFTEDEKKIIRAQFLRFIDPINYFLVPSKWKERQSNGKGKKIGENEDVINFMIKKNHETFGKKYEDFLDLALANKEEMISSKSLEELGKMKFTLIESADEASNKVKKNNKKQGNSSEETNSISNNTRQRRSFAFNGITYPLRGLALAVVNDYVSQNPYVTFEQLRQIFDIRLNFDRKPLIRRLNEVTQSEREHKRIFLDSPIRLHNDEVYVSSQWSYDVDFPRFQEILNNLDYQVQEL